MESKKPYAQPTLVRYGSVEEETRGVCSDCWEIFGTRPPTKGDCGGLGGGARMEEVTQQ